MRKCPHIAQGNKTMWDHCVILKINKYTENHFITTKLLLDIYNSQRFTFITNKLCILAVLP